MHPATSAPPTPDEAARRLASRQLGLLRTSDLVSCGLSLDQIAHRARSGSLVRLTRGLYAVGGTPAGWRRDALAACFAAGPDALASHLTAAAVHGLAPAPVLPHVLVPAKQSARTRIARVHRGNVDPSERRRVEGMPVTSPARTLVDVAGLVSRPTLETMVDDLLTDGRTSPREIQRALDRAGHRGPVGAGALVGALGVWAEPIRPGSPAEVRLLRQLQGWGLTGAVTQHEVREPDGTFVARLDVAVPERRLGWEYDSDRWHGPRAWGHDEGRLARLVALGWRIDDVSKVDLLPSNTRIRDSARDVVAAGV